MSGKSILQKIFDALQLSSVDDNANCVLTPRQCKGLLEQEQLNDRYIDHLHERVKELKAEISRLRGLLELERSDE